MLPYELAGQIHCQDYTLVNSLFLESSVMFPNLFTASVKKAPQKPHGQL